MNIRRQVFASEFSSEFKKILRREIANSDVLGKCHVRGVLVARGLVAPVLVACCKALRHALMAGINTHDPQAHGEDGRDKGTPKKSKRFCEPNYARVSQEILGVPPASNGPPRIQSPQAPDGASTPAHQAL
jgi:hypothetical protein